LVIRFRIKALPPPVTIESVPEDGPDSPGDPPNLGPVANTECRGLDSEDEVDGKYARDWDADASEGGRGMLSSVFKNMLMSPLSGAFEKEG
jgi:hypothetical protein